VVAKFELTNVDGNNDHLANNDLNSFWKYWNLKYQEVTSAPVAVHGLSDPGWIANAFKDHFANSLINSHDDTRANTEFEELCQTTEFTEDRSHRAFRSTQGVLTRTKLT